MQKTDVNNTALAIFFLALAVLLIGGLAVIPAFEEAEAKRCHTKDGQTICKVKVIKIK